MGFFDEILNPRSAIGYVARRIFTYHVAPRVLPYVAERFPDIFAELFPDLQGRMTEQDQGQVSLLRSSLEFVRNLAGAVTLLIGTRYTGKTEAAYRLGEYFCRPTYAVSPEQPPPYWIKRIGFSEIDKVPPLSTLICDDLPAYAGNYDYNDGLAQHLARIIPMVRHERKIQLIFCTQSAAQANKYVQDCELAMFKPLGILFEGYERANIQKIYKAEVNPYFAGKSEDWVLKHAWVRSRGGYVGGVTIKKTS